ncbi:electron transfer flavoprotein [Slackia heliotrinireducens]|uniref:electron transfer flavoprotein n=1 Tax=Slackia heliotrinireducens TaxID=84110 RepID=UPI003315AC0E
MNIVVALKIVPDGEDIRVAGDRSLDYSKARPIVSTYDLNAIEAAAQTAKAEGAKLYAVTVGDKTIADTKVTKDVRARGVDELVMAVDDTLAGLDALGTADALAATIAKIDDVDLIICGDGSADLYAQQVEVQLAAKMGVPVVTAAVAIAFEDGKAVVTRKLENEMETVEVTLPAVVSVLPDIALPRVCGMRDIMQAGKKPLTQYSAADLGCTCTCGTEVIETIAPEPAKRKLEIFDASVDGDIDKFVSAIKEAIK